MKILSHTTGKIWAPTEPAPDADEQAVAAARDGAHGLQQLLSELLLADNLLIMAGLGTSLTVKPADGSAAAPTMQDLWADVAKRAGDRLQPICLKVRYLVPDKGNNIELLLSQCQLSQHIQPDPEIEKFISDAEAIIVARCRFVSDTTDLPLHEAFLRKVARRSSRKPRVKLFTSNYDLCFETAAARTGFIVVDGFSHTQPQQFDGAHFAYDLVRREPGRENPDYIPNLLHLYKLHGSVDWTIHGSRVVRAFATDKPLIIYPRDSKFEASYGQPFLEMMSRFQIALREPDSGLLVVGFGLSDRHLTEPIMSAIRSNVSLKAAFVSPHIHATDSPVVKTISALIDEGDSRLALLAATFEELVEALPDLVAPTDDERHTMRLRKLDQ